MIKVRVAVPVVYPFAGFAPTTCALPSGILPSKNVTVPPVAAFLSVVTVAVMVIFCFTLPDLGLTKSVMALPGGGTGETGDSSATSAEQNRERAATGSTNNFNRQ